MQHESSFLTVKEHVATLNLQAKNFEPAQVLEFAMKRATGNRTALVSSFGAESVVLLHMVSQIDPSLPVLFIDTQMLFRETLTYQTDIARHLGLSDVRRIVPNTVDVSNKDPNGTLNEVDKNACCALRKTDPLQHVLSGFDTWITGRKWFQSGVRAELIFFESDGNRRVKVNPLAHWLPEDLQNYIKTHDLPKHPMLTQGFASIGCAPCTSPVKDGEDARAGRWRDNDKTECGIHFANGVAQRQPTLGELSS